jgi:hypothetical protein
MAVAADRWKVKMDLVVELAGARWRDTDADNEVRADWGEAGIIAADPNFGSNDVWTSCKDAITNACHAMSRMGLDDNYISDVLNSAFETFEQDRDRTEIGGAAPVRRDEARYPDMHEAPRIAAETAE